jgi:hypothetical protein
MSIVLTTLASLAATGAGLAEACTFCILGDFANPPIFEPVIGEAGIIGAGDAGLEPAPLPLLAALWPNPNPKPDFGDPGGL